MRIQKLRDFLLFYKEADLWAEYKNKNISTLAADVKEYEAGMTAARAAELKQYTDLKKHFLTKDVRGLFARYMPFEEEALGLIQKNHDVFIATWPKDIRGERPFVQSRIESFKTQLGFLRDRIRFLQRQLEGMLPEHPNRPKVEAEYKLKSESAMPMVLEEMEKLRQFDATYDKLEASQTGMVQAHQSRPELQDARGAVPAQLWPEGRRHRPGHRAPEGGAVREDTREQGPVPAAGRYPGTLRKGTQTLPALAAVYGRPFFGDAVQVRARLVGRPEGSARAPAPGRSCRRRRPRSAMRMWRRSVRRRSPNTKAAIRTNPPSPKQPTRPGRTRSPCRCRASRPADPRPSAPAWPRCPSRRPAMSS